MPQDCDDYVHRIGRTGRISSDSNGRAFTFVMREEGPMLTRIEMRVNQLLPEYLIPGFEAARPVKARLSVQELEPELPEEEEEEEFAFELI